MAMSASAKPAVRMLSLWNAFALVALAVIAAGGLFLQQSGRLDALVAFAMNGPQRPEPKPPPDFVVRVIDEQGLPVPRV
jgi:hypothetical protein